MTRAALFTRHRKVALGEAKDWHLPGLDPDDVRQECLLALWMATATWDPSRVSFGYYAKHAIRNHCTDLLRAATRQKRTADIDPDGLEKASVPDVVERVEVREQLRLFMSGDHEQSAQERRRRQWRESKRRLRAAAA